MQLSLPEAASNAIERLLEAVSPTQPTFPRACPNGGFDHNVVDGVLATDCPECEDVRWEIEFERGFDY